MDGEKFGEVENGEVKGEVLLDVGEGDESRRMINSGEDVGGCEKDRWVDGVKVGEEVKCRLGESDVLDLYVW